MNYLQLTNDLILESSVGDEVQSVESSQDYARKAVQWVRDAWVEIQRARKWKFRWAEGSFNTAISQSRYTRDEINYSDSDEFEYGTFWVVEGACSARLTKMAYEKLREKQRGANVYGKPVYFAEDQAGNLHFFPTPEKSYVVEFEYYTAPVFLTESGDAPGMPEEFHKAITWKALEQYARDEGGEWQGLYQTAIRNYNAIYSEMLNKCLPAVVKKSSF